MFDDDFAFLTSRGDTIRVRVVGGSTAASTREDRARAREALRELRLGILWNFGPVLRAIEQLHRALRGRSTDFSSLQLDAGLAREATYSQLLNDIEEEFELGRLVVSEGAFPLLEVPPEFELGVRERALDIEVPPPLARRAEANENLTLFDVRFVDEVGQPISGVAVEIEAGDRLEKLTTNGAGVALLEDVTSMSASVRLVDVAALEAILDPRWETERSGSAPSGANTTSVVFTGAGLGAVSLKPAVPNTVVIQPPLGKLFVELWDKNGRVLHVGQDYEISGPASLSGTTDEQGRLLHEELLPGDYELALSIKLDPGDGSEVVDTETAKLVVLAPAAAAPQIRMLGVVPHVEMVRLRGMLFDTNKSFLLPSAIEPFRTVRDFYRQSNPSDLLIVGHTNATGEPDINDPLSEERAESARAYLMDDVDAWLGNYDLSGSKRWGSREDGLMLRSLPDFGTKGEAEDSVTWFQRTRSLGVDGVAGPETRRQLITEYMALDGSPFSEEPDLVVLVQIHGAGENFPLKDTGFELDTQAAGSHPDAFDRRVEFFFFEPEFGILPAPAAPNGKEYLNWRERSDLDLDLIAGQVAPTEATVIEVEDVFFRTDSAVVHHSLKCASAFALALIFADTKRDHRLLIAGHTDTRAPDSFNQPLSEERAENSLAVLEGNRARFVELSEARNKVGDHKQILRFLTEQLAFDCDPSQIDDNAFTAVAAVKQFQEQYNARRAALGVPDATEIGVDGSVGPETWGAFFDCYEAFLAGQVSSASDVPGQLEDLKELRTSLAFVDDEKKTLGFGERFPEERPGVDNVASATNRRVELLFFPVDDVPNLEGSLDDSEIYLPGRFKKQQIDPCEEPPPPPPPPPPPVGATKGKIFVRVVQADGSRVTDVAVFLFDRRVGRSQIDFSETSTGEVDFGERDPGTYEVDVSKDGFQGNSQVFDVVAGETSVVTVLVTRIGQSEEGRIVTENVTTVFRTVARQDVSPFVGPFFVVGPPSVAGEFRNPSDFGPVRDAQAKLEHEAAVANRIAELKAQNGDNLIRTEQVPLKPVLLQDFTVEDERTSQERVVRATIIFTDSVTSRTVLINTLAK